MLRLTREADYGIVLMTSIASSPRDHHSARELAEDVRLPLPTVSKILKRLTRGGLLASARGVKGGYHLTRRPDQVTVADMVAALDGPIAMTECAGTAPRGCEHESFCRVRTNWQMINRAVRVALENLTLADMTKPHAEEHLLTVQSAGSFQRKGPSLETS